MLKSGYRKCPKCGMWLERISGCARVTCSRCNESMCFNCPQNAMFNNPSGSVVYAHLN